ncbi:MAG TPA: MBL fold metallo-hydrolase [Thermoanaerobaculia bacterium]
MYRIHMLPAYFGDSLLIEYGPGDGAKPKRILIDAGTAESYPAVRKALEAIPKAERVFELLVVTHIDIDHIGGILPLLDDAKALGLKFKEIWFNGYEHLTDLLGPKQGEQLSARIVDGGYKWNARFDGRAVVVPDDGPLPRKDVAGMKITLLSPMRAQLLKLEKEWQKVIKAAGLVPGVGAKMPPEEIDDLLGDEAIDVESLATSKFKSDTSAPNGSSIAFVATYDGKSVLFGADAFPKVLAASLARMSEEERKKVSIFKLPHHGSRNNLSSELLAELACGTFLVSSNGQRYSHPNKEAIARIIHRGNKPRILFNYRSEFNDFWDDAALKKQHKYSVKYGGDGGLTIDV